MGTNKKATKKKEKKQKRDIFVILYSPLLKIEEMIKWNQRPITTQ